MAGATPRTVAEERRPPPGRAAERSPARTRGARATTAAHGRTFGRFSAKRPSARPGEEERSRARVSLERPDEEPEGERGEERIERGLEENRLVEGDDAGQAEEGCGGSGSPVAEEPAGRGPRESRRQGSEEGLDGEDRLQRAARHEQDRGDEVDVEGRDEERLGKRAEKEVAAGHAPGEVDVRPRVEPVARLKERMVRQRRDDGPARYEDEEHRDEERQVPAGRHQPGC